MSHRFGPKPADHPTVGGLCAACRVAFKAGDYTALIPLGPGDDEEERAKARAGRAYTAVAVEVHWDCADGRPDLLRETQVAALGSQLLDVQKDSGRAVRWARAWKRAARERRARFHMRVSNHEG